jgi:thiol:disulfide interchange protein DsbD
MSLKRIGASIVFACGLAASVGAVAGVSILEKTPKEDSKFLPVDQAFEIQPLETRAGKLVVSWRIAPGYYLYRQRIAFELVEPKGASLGAAQLPSGEKHHDEYFGDVEVYHLAMLAAQLPLKGGKPAKAKVKVSYQGCADAGLCYPPQEKVLEFTP